ncbi:MAG: DUF1080 domain-containing protein [Verrucomicrobia bacterium]|nr:MAG: DUF1080 domain-containing protein [Verrucomicrobiota bacterium]TAE89095.1 MAG: DUF1080 domain-containing protein [Verrucomicrobiota bacterium]TAF28032.1 MAG: DUF1080 domain-containing protein [Verrucomicrobiota bacterium]TAF42879.1 MAG: DUF1080 domain-containing protein [Verrucomicrobiota bacterium]
MRKMQSMALAGCLAAGGVAFGADGVGVKPGTPEIPGTAWQVHDGTRPQPVVVETAGALSVKAPSDAKVLFDGSSLDAWTAGGDKPAPWIVKDGVMIANQADIRTKESFGPMQLHLEWRIPAGREVNGQSGGNSGVFLMGMYEVQVLQSHTNRTYPDGTAGALYGQTPPLVNATAPQGEWQSYEILFHPPKYEGGKVAEPATVTVIQNGVVLHHSRRYMGPTQHRQVATYPENHPATGPIGLQFHGDPIEFRNIWVRPIGEYDAVK